MTVKLPVLKDVPVGNAALVAALLCVTQACAATGSPSTSTSTSSTPDSSAAPRSQHTGFACSISGAEAFSPAIEAEAVCARFRTTFATALGEELAHLAGSTGTSAPAAAKPSGKPSAKASPAPAAPVETPAGAGDHWFSAAIRASKNGVVRAEIREMTEGRLVIHPARSVAVSDRAPGLFAIDQLARSMAQQIRAARLSSADLDKDRGAAPGSQDFQARSSGKALG